MFIANVFSHFYSLFVFQGFCDLYEMVDKCWQIPSITHYLPAFCCSQNRERRRNNTSRSPVTRGSLSSESNPLLKQALASIAVFHNDECRSYMKQPTSHPNYAKELQIYMGAPDSLSQIALGMPHHYIVEQFNIFWNNRLQTVFEEEWQKKKNNMLQLMTAKSGAGGGNSRKRHRERRSRSPVRRKKSRRSRSGSDRFVGNKRSNSKSGRIICTSNSEIKQGKTTKILSTPPGSARYTPTFDESPSTPLPPLRNKFAGESVYNRLEQRVDSVACTPYNITSSQGEIMKFSEPYAISQIDDYLGVPPPPMSTNVNISPPPVRQYDVNHRLVLPSTEIGIKKSPTLEKSLPPTMLYPSTLTKSPSPPPAIKALSDEEDDEVPINVVSVLSVVNELAHKVGALGSAVPVMLQKVKDAEAKKLDPLHTMNVEDLTLFEMISSRFSSIVSSDSTSFVEKIIVEEAATQLAALIKVLKTPKRPKINIKEWADLTVHMNTGDTLRFLRRKIEDTGCKKDIQTLYMALKEEHRKLINTDVEDKISFYLPPVTDAPTNVKGSNKTTKAVAHSDASSARKTKVHPLFAMADEDDYEQHESIPAQRVEPETKYGVKLHYTQREKPTSLALLNTQLSAIRQENRSTSQRHLPANSQYIHLRESAQTEKQYQRESITQSMGGTSSQGNAALFRTNQTLSVPASTLQMIKEEYDGVPTSAAVSRHRHLM